MTDVFRTIPEPDRIQVFRRLTQSEKRTVLSKLFQQEAVSVLEKLSPDDASDALQLLDRKTQERYVAALSDHIRKEIQSLLQFDADTAGGLMRLDYVQVDEGQTVADAARALKHHERRTGRIPVVLIMRGSKLLGYFPPHELALADRNDLVAQYVKKIHTIHHGSSHDDVLEIFRDHPHSKLAVVDSHGIVRGIIYSDDVLKLINEQQGASLGKFAGIHSEEDAMDPARVKIAFRYKWLIINLATSFLAAFTVGLFEKTLDKYVLLAVYMPIVAGMGGNAATQTLAVMVRGIAQDKVTIYNFAGPLWAEVRAGLVNGVINGVLVFLVVVLLNREPLIGFILFCAMIVNLFVAASFGTIVPVVMKALGKDPASSATIFITTATDVLGFLAFLGLATVLLR